MISLLRKAVFLVLIAVVLTACAKSSEPSPAPVPAPTTSTPSAPAPDGSQRYVLVKEDSKASYVVTELLAGATVRNEAIGTTSDITGELVLDSQGKVQPTTFTVDLRTLRSDRGPRDNYIRSSGLESNRYPTATFAVAEVKGAPTFEQGSQETFELVGPMKVRETERTVTWSVTSTVQDGKITWKAVQDTRLTDWGINPPVLLVRSVANVDDPFKLEVVLAFEPADN